MIVLNYPAREGGSEGGMEKYEGSSRGMVQPSQKHVLSCVKGIKWELGY